jgi:hypothetical protein
MSTVFTLSPSVAQIADQDVNADHHPFVGTQAGVAVRLPELASSLTRRKKVRNHWLDGSVA